MKKLLASLILLILCVPAVCAEEALEAFWYELSTDAAELTVRLDANATTGFQWICSVENDGIIRLVSEEYIPDETDGVLCGSGGTYVARFAAAAAEDGSVCPGETGVTFDYLRTWEEDSQIRTAMLLLSVNANGEISIEGELLTDVDPEADSGLEIEYNEDFTAFTVRLAAQAGTGYEWNCAIDDEELLEMTDCEYVAELSSKPIAGGPLTYTAGFRAPVQADGSVLPGETMLTFTYARSWEEGEVPDEVIVYRVTVAEDGTLNVE